MHQCRPSSASSQNRSDAQQRTAAGPMRLRGSQQRYTMSLLHGEQSADHRQSRRPTSSKRPRMRWLKTSCESVNAVQHEARARSKSPPRARERELIEFSLVLRCWGVVLPRALSGWTVCLPVQQRAQLRRRSAHQRRLCPRPLGLRRPMRRRERLELAAAIPQT